MASVKEKDKYVGHGANIDKMYRVYQLGDKIYGKVIKALHGYADNVLAHPDSISDFIDRESWLACAKHTKTLSDKNFDELFEAMLFGAGSGALFQVFIVSYMDTIFGDGVSAKIKGIKGFGKAEIEKVHSALKLN